MAKTAHDSKGRFTSGGGSPAGYGPKRAPRQSFTSPKTPRKTLINNVHETNKMWGLKPVSSAHVNKLSDHHLRKLVRNTHKAADKAAAKSFKSASKSIRRSK